MPAAATGSAPFTTAATMDSSPRGGDVRDVPHVRLGELEHSAAASLERDLAHGKARTLLVATGNHCRAMPNRKQAPGRMRGIDGRLRRRAGRLPVSGNARTGRSPP